MTEHVRLDALELSPLRFSLRRVAANARARWAEREGVVVAVRTRDVVGVGEASPLPGYSPDPLADAVRALERARDRLVGATLSLGGAPLDALGALLHPLGPMAPSARFALETALLDLRGRLRGIPAWRDLGGDPAAGPLPLSALLSGQTEAEVARDAEDALRRGLAVGKLKVGRPGALARELARAAAASRAGGGALRLRLDANGAWSTKQATTALERFASYAPELVEEPVAGGLWLELGPAPVPLAVDESAAAPGGARLLELLLERGLCDAVIVKLSAVGGLIAAAAIAARAAAAGRSVIVTHMFEGPVASAASAAFAFARCSRAQAAGLDVRSYLELPDEHPIGPASVVASELPGVCPDAIRAAAGAAPIGPRAAR